jgi:1-deoxy-D-xylulose-5-phosphate reductoisomerase
LNNLDFKKINKKKFPIVNLLKQLPDKQSLFETVIISSNDALFNLFLNKKINFTDINKILFKLINLNEFNKYKKLKPNSVEDILKLNKYVNFKINQLSI